MIINSLQQSYDELTTKLWQNYDHKYASFWQILWRMASVTQDFRLPSRYIISAGFPKPSGDAPLPAFFSVTSVQSLQSDSCHCWNSNCSLYLLTEIQWKLATTDCFFVNKPLCVERTFFGEHCASFFYLTKGVKQQVLNEYEKKICANKP